MTTFSHHFRIPFHEVDAAGIMFHAHLFSHAHEAYASVMRHLGMDLKTLLQEGRYLIPLVHVEADFQCPLVLDDEIRILLHPLSPGNSSFGFRYQFIKENEPCARALSRHVFLDRATQRPCPLPGDFRQKLLTLGN